MKKRKALGLVLAGILAASVLTPMTAMADSTKVVTLGADLSEDQRVALLKYFGVYGQNIPILYITNQDERNNLGSYVPLSVIGTRTFSSALVNPTNSGGIQVKTANLTWVTGNMIASTLSTAGVKNCEVLAAAPFEVSGTGALTGVMMAFETASNTSLDPEKKDIANQELVTTTTIAENVGQQEATSIVNEIKIQIIEGQVADQGEAEEVVDEVVEHYNNSESSSFTDSDRALLYELAGRIAQQEYNYEDVRETLERVESNTSTTPEVVVNVNVEGDNINIDNNNTNTNNNDNTSSAQNTNENNQISEDSILNQADASALGGDVVTTTTVEPEVNVDVDQNQEASQEADQSQQAEQNQDAPVIQDDSGIQIVSSDSFTVDENGNVVENPEVPADEPIQIDEPAPEEQNWIEDAGSVDQPAPEEPIQVVETAPAEEPVPEPAPVEEPAPEPAPVEEPAPEQQPEAPAVEEIPAAVAELVLDNTNVELIPSETDNVSGLNLLAIRIGVPNVEIAANDDGSFGTVVVKNNGEETRIILQDAADPSSPDKKVVAIQAMDMDDANENGWFNGGTDVFVNLGSALQTSSLSEITISIQNLTFVQKAEDGTVIAKGTFNTNQTVYTDEVGFTFDITDITELTAGSTVSGRILLPANADDGSVIYSAYIDDPENAQFFVSEDGRSFTADLLEPGITELTVEVSSDGGNSYIPYTFTLEVLEKKD